MKLNPECVRDTLIYLEDNLVMCEYFSIKGISFKTIINELSQDNKYSEEDVAYTLTQLMSAGYITGYKNYNGKDRKLSGHVDDISWSGHNFIRLDQRQYGMQRKNLRRKWGLRLFMELCHSPVQFLMQ